jgi:hypothetical protein
MDYTSFAFFIASLVGRYINISNIILQSPQLKSLLKTLHLLGKKHKYQYLILASLILVACYIYILIFNKIDK